MLSDIQGHHVQLKQYLSEWCKHQEQIIYSSVLAKERKDSKDLLEKVEQTWLLLHDLQGLVKGNSAQEEVVANAMLKLKEALGKGEVSPFKMAPMSRLQDALEVATESPAAPLTEGSIDGAIHDIIGKNVFGGNMEMQKLVTMQQQGKETLAAVRLSELLKGETLELSSKKIMGKASNSLARIVHSNAFDVLSMVVIVCNAITLGISADYDMKHLHLPENKVLLNLEITFVLFYIIEALLRICASPYYYACGPNWRWNAFDTLLIALSLADLVPKLLGSRDSGLNVSFLRTARILKMVRVLRIVRVVKSFKPLRLILSSVMGSISAVVWSGALVVITLYVCSICLVEGCVSLLETKTDVSPTTRVAIDDYWSTFFSAMHSLFLASFGGTDWKSLSEPLVEAGAFYYAFFIFYLLFFSIVIMNTVTSIFLDSVLQSSSEDDEARIQDELSKKLEYIQMLTDFFEEIDDDKDGLISLQEFCKHMEDPRLLMFASTLDIEIADAKQFFDIISDHGRVQLDIDSFVVGCIKLKGNARSIDLFTVFQLVKTVYEEFKVLRADLDEWQFSKIRRSGVDWDQSTTSLNEQAESSSATKTYDRVLREYTL